MDKEKLKILFWQVFKFGVVGVIATAIDFGVIYIVRDLMNIDYLIAGILGFSISLVANYFLSMAFVFKTKEGLSKTNSTLIFIILSIIGALLNELILYLGHGCLAFDLYLVKFFSTIIVLVYNFISKKIFLEREKKPKIEIDYTDEE